MSDSSSIASPITVFPAAASLSTAHEQVAQAERQVQRRQGQVMRIFMGVQTAYCAYLLLKWVWQGHYIGGPIYAVLIWCLLWLLAVPLSLLWRPQVRALERAQAALGSARLEAGKAFLASQSLGAYRWVCRSGRMLGVFPERQVLYVSGGDLGDRQVLIEAPLAVKQVHVDEKTFSQSTSHTTTTHGRRHVFAFSKHMGMVGKGTSRSTTTTTDRTSRSFTLNVQVQAAGQDPWWVQLPFGADWQEALNWKLLVEQAAGRQ